MLLVPAFIFWLFLVEYRIAGGCHTPALYFLMCMTAQTAVCGLLSGLLPFSEAGYFYYAVVAGMFWAGHLVATIVFERAGGGTTQAFRNRLLLEFDKAIAKGEFQHMLVFAFVVGSIAGVVSVASLWQTVLSHGIGIRSITDIALAPAYFSSLRYIEGVNPEPMVVRVCEPLLESAAAAAGILWGRWRHSAKRYLAGIPPLIGLLMMCTTGERQYLILPCTWLLGSLIAVNCVMGREFKQMKSPRFWLTFLSLLSLAFLFLSSMQILRYAGSAEVFSFDHFFSQIARAMASSIASVAIGTTVFDLTAHAEYPLHFFAYTAGPAMAWLGLESIRYPTNIWFMNGTTDSNVYSLPGFLLLDLGPFFTALQFFLTGFLSMAAIHIVRRGWYWLFPVVIAISCVILFTPIHSFFFFTTHVVLLAVMIAACAFLQALTRKARVAP